MDCINLVAPATMPESELSELYYTANTLHQNTETRLLQHVAALQAELNQLPHIVDYQNTLQELEEYRDQVRALVNELDSQLREREELREERDVYSKQIEELERELEEAKQ